MYIINIPAKSFKPEKGVRQIYYGNVQKSETLLKGGE